MGLIHIYHGNGKGKTTACIGLGIRAAGYHIPVILAQFLKNDTSSEIRILKGIEEFHVLHGEKEFGFYFQMSEEEKIEAKLVYGKLFEEATDLGSNIATENQAKRDVGALLILDEILDVCKIGFIEEESLIHFLENKPSNLEVVLSGRNPSEELLALADYVSEIKKEKHPYDKHIPARNGIDK